MNGRAHRKFITVTWLPKCGAEANWYLGLNDVSCRSTRERRAELSPDLSASTETESSPTSPAMSRDKEEDIIDVDGSEGEEEYEVESITGFKWEVSFGAQELPCRYAGCLQDQTDPADSVQSSFSISWEWLRVFGPGCGNCSVPMQYRKRVAHVGAPSHRFGIRAVMGCGSGRQLEWLIRNGADITQRGKEYCERMALM